MVSMWRQTFREQYSWLLLPAFLIFSFTVDSRSGTTNFMRVLCFPLVLFALSIKDYKAIWANPAARAFWLFIAWLNITLLWDGLSHKDWWFFQRNFHLFTLMGMVYLVATYKPEKQDVVFYTYLFGGFVYVMLVFVALPESYSIFEHPFISRDYIARGIFPITIYVGWVMMVLTLLSIYGAARAKGHCFRQIAFVAFASLFAYMVLVSQSQAAWIGTILGAVLLFFLGKRQVWVVALGLISIILFANGESSRLIVEGISQGDSYRLAIWKNAIDNGIATPWHILLGFGLSSSTVNSVEGYPGLIPHYHSLYMNTLWYGGLIGFSCYALLLYKIIEKIWATKNTLLFVVVIAMQVVFLVDGEYLFVTPSAMMLSYILFLFFVMFFSNSNNGLNAAIW